VSFEPCAHAHRPHWPCQELSAKLVCGVLLRECCTFLGSYRECLCQESDIASFDADPNLDNPTVTTFQGRCAWKPTRVLLAGALVAAAAGSQHTQHTQQLTWNQLSLRPSVTETTYIL
jgi:hypothetical protein